jgi:creatinine amidohydrolase
MGFPGTLSVRPETLEFVCRDYVTSLAAHGFDAILLFPSHGGNFAPLKEMLPRLREAAGARVQVEAYTDLSGFLEIWRGAITQAGGDASGVGGHAGLAETSEMLRIRPDLVRMDRAIAGVPGPPSQSVLERVFREGFRAVTPVGVLGDPRGSSAELGKACLDAVAREVSRTYLETLGEPTAHDRR